MLGENTLKPRNLLLVELVGPAGAGKTTLSRSLIRRSAKIQIGAEIELRKLKHLLIFVRDILSLMPVLVKSFWNGRWFTWDELKALAYLKGWIGVLRRQPEAGSGIILLDHGPVFKLATLHEFGPEKMRNGNFDAWWNTTINQWASALDAVIWLDAPDSILEERINFRDQRHQVKGRSDAEVSLFLGRYRSSYEQILSKLTASNGPALLQFDTSAKPTAQIVDEILENFGVASPQDR